MMGLLLFFLKATRELRSECKVAGDGVDVFVVCSFVDGRCQAEECLRLIHFALNQHIHVEFTGYLGFANFAVKVKH